MKSSVKKEGLEKAYRMKQEMEIKQLDESCRQYKGKCVLWKCVNDAVCTSNTIYTVCGIEQEPFCYRFFFKKMFSRKIFWLSTSNRYMQNTYIMVLNI